MYAFNVENSLSGGSISFALTLLNSRDNGFILNVIHNSTGCHVYLKEIKEAACKQVLAEEEKISLDMALKYDEKKKQINNMIPESRYLLILTS